MMLFPSWISFNSDSYFFKKWKMILHWKAQRGIIFFKIYLSEWMDISEWQKYFCMQKISILSSKLSVLEPFLIVSSFGLFNEVSFFFYFFKNYAPELMDIPEWKKYPCMQKISILPSNLSILEPYFSFLKGVILT